MSFVFVWIYQNRLELLSFYLKYWMKEMVFATNHCHAQPDLSVIIRFYTTQKMMTEGHFPEGGTQDTLND